MKTKITIVLLFAFIQMNAQWTQQTSNTTSNLISVTGIGDTCYTTGTSAYQKTFDGGTTWSPIAATFTVAGSYVKMYDANKIFLGKSNGTISYSMDGGVNWVNSTPTSNIYGVYDMDFLNSSTYLFVGGSNVAPYNTGGSFVRKTIDSCNSWVSGSGISSNGATIFGLSHNSKYNISVGGGQTIRKCIWVNTAFWGNTWTDVKTLTAGPHAFYDVDFPNFDSVGYVVGGSGRGTSGPAVSGIMYKSIDHGLTWTKINTLPPVGSLYGVHFSSIDTGFVVGFGGIILKTENGGVSWTTQPSGVTTSLNSIYFTSTKVGYIVGNGGVILKTINAGDPNNVTSVIESNGSKYSLLTGFDRVTIQTKENINGNLSVLNSIGQYQSIENVSGTNFEISTSGLSSGIYFFHLNELTGKFIVQ